MSFTKIAVVVVVGFTVGISSAAADEVRTPADDTVYPVVTGMVAGTELIGSAVIGSEGFVFPGPRTAHVRTPATEPSRARPDDVVYP